MLVVSFTVLSASLSVGVVTVVSNVVLSFTLFSFPLLNRPAHTSVVLVGQNF